MERKTYLGRYLITLDQYEQPIRLASERNAVTYKAFDAQSNREVALEIIPGGAVKISVQAKLEAEADAAKRLQQINIPLLYDFGVENNELIYASELVDGTSAEHWVTTHGPLPIGSALRIASQVVNAIRAATFHGIFHHALNPGNIMIVPGQTAEGEWPLIKVMKFVGLAPAYTRGDASAASATDKINFVAPEQIESGTADFASEIYSLGCTLWFLLSGVPPLAGATTVEGANRVPGPVRRLITNMLALDPADRPHDPIVLHEQIEDCIAEVENKRVIMPPKVAAPVVPVAAAETIDARPRRPFPWQPIAVAAVILALAGLAAAVLPATVRSFTHRGEIGVPIGVPDRVAAAAAEAPPVATASLAPSPEEAKTQAVSASPGVLVSTANVSDNEAIADSSPSSEEPPAPAATAAPVLASNAPAQAHMSEPEPPSEGPEMSSPPPPPEPSLSPAFVEAAPEPTAKPAAEVAAPSRSLIASNDEPARRTTRAIEEEKPVSKSTRTPVKKTQVSSSAPRLREGRVRAQYLGTTPEGEMVFGLPSEQRGYLAPEEAARRESRRHRRMMVRPAEPPDTLPVLPALPPDE